jgi:hypothetical protein
MAESKSRWASLNSCFFERLIVSGFVRQALRQHRDRYEIVEPSQFLDGVRKATSPFIKPNA